MSISIPRSILVATDLSHHAADALRTASALAARSGAELHVLHALDDPWAGYGQSAGSHGAAARVVAAEGALDAHVARTLGATAPVTSSTVELCSAAGAIVRFAEEHGVDLIVLGASTQSALEPAWMQRGTVDRVLSDTTTPCLVVAGPLNLPLRRIVVPVDLAKRASRAVACAVGWARAFGHRSSRFEDSDEVDLRVVHVLEGLIGAELGIERALVGPDLHPVVQAALRCSQVPAGIAITQELLLDGAPGGAIARYAADQQADLVVLAQRGRPALRHWFGYGTIPAVLGNQPCGVLVLPPATSSGGADPLRASSPLVHAGVEP